MYHEQEMDQNFKYHAIPFVVNIQRLNDFRTYGSSQQMDDTGAYALLVSQATQLLLSQIKAILGPLTACVGDKERQHNR